MRKLFKFLKIVLAVIVIIFIGLFIFIQTLKPTYNGTIDLEHISSEVSVHYDTFGIPHIYADNEHDAFVSLGYVHAQDRLWQMELLRRIPSGRLSELFGKDLIRTDRFFIGLGIDEASDETIKKLDPNSEAYKLAIAYLEGINQFIKDGPTPIEYYLTGIDKKDFTLKDVQNIVGYMAFSFAMAHKTDPLLTNIKNNLGIDYLHDLDVAANPNTLHLKSHNTDTTTVHQTMLAAIDKALSKIPAPQFIGSNSWVLGPEKTASGKVVFANDPHIAFSQPGVWYEAHVHTPQYEIYGYHLAGTPFPFLGHNRKIAYGLTMFQNDDLNFYWEENHPTDSTLYKTPNGWKKYEYKTKTIKVKDGEDVSITVKASHHGPIMNGIADEITHDKPVAVSWVFTQHDNQIMEVGYKMSHATNKEEFKQAMPLIHAPGLNVMYGDAENNVAWYAVGKLYELPEHANSKLFLNGADGKDEPIRYLEFSENPQAVNPPWNYVYSANNQPDSIITGLYPGYYLPENRAKRIVKLLDAKDNWDMSSTQTMILDVTSDIHPQIIKEVLLNLNKDELSNQEQKAFSILNNWDGNNELTAIAPTLYHKFIYRYLKNTFYDELDEVGFEQLLKTHLVKRTLAPLIFNKTSVWYDDVSTKDITENRTTIFKKSFTEAIQALEKQLGNNIDDWTWNKVHTLEHEHPIGKVAALRSFFNVGPFEVNGTREVINNLLFFYNGSGEYHVKAGPSTRRIVDFSDIENGMSILPTGQSGNPFSPHYNDQAEMYVKGEFRKMMLNTEEIKSTSKNHLIIK